MDKVDQLLRVSLYRSLSFENRSKEVGYHDTFHKLEITD